MIHELRQLARTKKLFDGSSYRLGVDDVLRHQAFAFNHTESFTHSTLYTNQSDAKDVLGHFTNAADAAVTEVVDIIDDALTVSNIDQTLQHIHDVVFIENTGTGDFFPAKTPIEFHATHSRQVVSIFGKEQVVEQRLCSFFRWRLTGAHHTIDLDLCLQLTAGLVDANRIGNIRTAIEIVGIDKPHFLGTNLKQNR